MATVIGFRPTEKDEKLLREVARPGENTTDTLRRALRALRYEQWLQEFHEDAMRIKDEDLSDEPDAW
jgi:antitoxin ParD1/3/4